MYLPSPPNPPLDFEKNKAESMYIWKIYHSYFQAWKEASTKLREYYMSDQNPHKTRREKTPGKTPFIPMK